MIKVLGKLPKKVSVACSGGPDSMAVLDFLVRSRRDVNIIHFNHGTKHSVDAERLVSDYANSKNIPIKIYNISGKPCKNQSKEAWWSTKRYEVFHKADTPVVTGHNLNDVAEWWIFTSLRGNPRVMPYNNKNVIRPFLLTRKNILENWCEKYKLPIIALGLGEKEDDLQIFKAKQFAEAFISTN